jgi:hypothetical protein
MPPTRYFVVLGVNPTSKDLSTFIDGCSKAGSDYYAYHVVPSSANRTRFKGFFVLKGLPMHVTNVERLFPNFLVKRMPDSMEGHVEGVTLPSSVIVVGIHPYFSVKENLLRHLV